MKVSGPQRSAYLSGVLKAISGRTRPKICGLPKSYALVIPDGCGRGAQSLGSLGGAGQPLARLSHIAQGWEEAAIFARMHVPRWLRDQLA